MIADKRRTILNRLVTSIPIAAVVSIITLNNASACACCETYAVSGVASSDRLNIGSGAGVRYDIIGSFGPHDRCIVLNAQDEEMRMIGNWVELPQGGWVNRWYLQYRLDG